MRISVSGILIAVFIGIMFGLKMQDDYLYRNTDGQTQGVLRQVISPVAMVESEIAMEQGISEELEIYMKRNFDFSTLKTHWAQYIKGYDVTIDKGNVYIAVRTNLEKPGSQSNYILNAVQGFAKSRLPQGYEHGRITVLGLKGKALTAREL
ncbi:hypothetical protein [Aneurinibacillus aneurinilyticus]|jgi:hypothetical protein|uniref:hypothetical protein n=1 Tax=Aneurinibacillus aneurinilyticus TaxID=1391 RepID=UPI0023F76B02|nr:hypothetical protein [Aneurinibacillus aneurinilyticus]MCI1695574.1 hypothetical protein [Aneurinibacillus aneurinilyticus]